MHFRLRTQFGKPIFIFTLHNQGMTAAPRSTDSLQITLTATLQHLKVRRHAIGQGGELIPSL